MILGIDVSHYQNAIDWSKAKAAGVGFAFIKSSEGTAGTDAFYFLNAVGCKKNEIPHGAYHFFKADKDWRKQAAHFAKYAEVCPLIPAVDVEVKPRLYPKWLMERNLQKFLVELEKLIGRKPVIYTSPGFWNSNLPRNDWAKNYPLWVAHWTTAPLPLLPYDWGLRKKTWTFWQNSAKGSGPIYGTTSKSVDLDKFNGDAEQLAKLVQD